MLRTSNWLQCSAPSHEGEQEILYSGLYYQICRLGTLNVSLIHDIFNLGWVYWNITILNKKKYVYKIMFRFGAWRNGFSTLFRRAECLLYKYGDVSFSLEFYVNSWELWQHVLVIPALRRQELMGRGA